MEPSRPATPLAGEKFRVLVVEDEWNIARLIMTHMEQAGFDTRHASNGQLALEVFEMHKPHLVLLDVMLPMLSGREVCQKLRETSTVPIIMLTALDSAEDEVLGFRNGADDYIAKPFNPKLLVARVITMLRRVYRYDFFTDTETGGADQNPTAKHLPSDWVSCEACGYMGPSKRFDDKDTQGNHVTRCPNCKRADRIIYSLG